MRATHSGCDASPGTPKAFPRPRKRRQLRNEETMTLAIHGKSPRRKAALGIAALLGVAVALLAGLGSFTSSPLATAQTGGTGSVTIVKQGLAGSDVATFTDDIPADADGTFDLSAASDSIVFDGLAAGTYHVTEAPLAGYSLT